MDIKLFQDLFEPIGDNIGGALGFRFAPIDWIDEMPRLYRGEVITPIKFKTGFAWVDGWCLEESLGATEKKIDTDNGALFDQSIQCIIPKPIANNEEAYMLMRNLTFMVNMRDANDEYKLYGTPQHGLKFGTNKNTGTKHSDLNHHALQFYGQSVLPAVNYLITT